MHVVSDLIGMIVSPIIPSVVGKLMIFFLRTLHPVIHAVTESSSPSMHHIPVSLTPTTGKNIKITTCAMHEP